MKSFFLSFLDYSLCLHNPLIISIFLFYFHHIFFFHSSSHPLHFPPFSVVAAPLRLLPKLISVPQPHFARGEISFSAIFASEMPLFCQSRLTFGLSPLRFRVFGVASSCIFTPFLPIFSPKLIAPPHF